MCNVGKSFRWTSVPYKYICVYTSACRFLGNFDWISINHFTTISISAICSFSNSVLLGRIFNAKFSFDSFCFQMIFELDILFDIVRSNSFNKIANFSFDFFLVILEYNKNVWTFLEHKYLHISCVVIYECCEVLLYQEIWH